MDAWTPGLNIGDRESPRPGIGLSVATNFGGPSRAASVVAIIPMHGIHCQNYRSGTGAFDMDGLRRAIVGASETHKARSELKNTEVVVMCDNAELVHVERLKAAGAYAVVAHPPDLAGLFGHVDSALAAVTT